MKSTAAVCILFLTFIAISCAKKNSPSKSVAAKPTTYAMDVKSIVQSKCTPCHIPADGGKKTAFDSYVAVRNNLDSIIRRIQLAPHEKGFMPAKKEALPAAEIAVFKKWQADGAAE